MIEKKNFWFVVLPFFQKKHKIKNKVAIKATFILMMKILKARSPTQIRFRLGRDKRIFFLKSVE